MVRKLFALSLLALTLHACGGPEDDQQQGDPAAQDTADQNATTADDAQPAACGAVTWKNYANAFFKSRCATCHAQAFSSVAKVKASSAKAQLSAGAMPRGARLDPATKKKILAWFTCGSP